LQRLNLCAGEAGNTHKNSSYQGCINIDVGYNEMYYASSDSQSLEFAEKIAVSPQYIVYKGQVEHERYITGVKGVMLGIKIDANIMTSGETTTNYGNNPGWEIID